ncbi:DUF4240 domain-containing protein [Chitinophaga solisilvae]|uniref:DUF4240 domain-containing protein n=1 Tax=Chitinophaga solisilvae TaxID=1233460 RepID=UPI00136FBACE|nr:DUF4240 domain-containing protein [Chitinophaga solisilvae]
MEKETFWKIMETASTAAEEEKAGKITQLLTSCSLEDITDFEIILREAIIELDDFSIMGILKVMTGRVSDDAYVYFRCWLISQGKAVVETARTQPDNLAAIVHENTYPDFEELLYVADDAYLQKSGLTEEEAEDNLPRNVAYERGLDYDFEAPPTKGIQWTADDLPRLYPKLWAVYNA